MAFRSRARQFERKLSQTFLSKLRGRERSSVEVVNPAPSNFMRVVTRWSQSVCSGPKWLGDSSTFFAGWLSSVDIGWSSGTVKSARWTVMVWAGRSTLAGNMLRWKCEETSLQPCPPQIHPTSQLLSTISSTINHSLPTCAFSSITKAGFISYPPGLSLFHKTHLIDYLPDVIIVFFPHKWNSKIAAQNHLQMKGVTHFSLVVFILGVVQACTQRHPKRPKRCLAYIVLISKMLLK